MTKRGGSATTVGGCGLCARALGPLATSSVPHTQLSTSHCTGSQSLSPVLGGTSSCPLLGSTCDLWAGHTGPPHLNTKDTQADRHHQIWDAAVGALGRHRPGRIPRSSHPHSPLFSLQKLSLEPGNSNLGRPGLCNLQAGQPRLRMPFCNTTDDRSIWKLPEAERGSFPLPQRNQL